MAQNNIWRTGPNWAIFIGIDDAFHSAFDPGFGCRRSGVFVCQVENIVGTCCVRFVPIGNFCSCIVLQKTALACMEALFVTCIFSWDSSIRYVGHPSPTRGAYLEG